MCTGVMYPSSAESSSRELSDTQEEVSEGAEHDEEGVGRGVESREQDGPIGKMGVSEG